MRGVSSFGEKSCSWRGECLLEGKKLAGMAPFGEKILFLAGRVPVGREETGGDGSY